jgi:enamine deaminase RidA (YjgF/YER057c/UK114 family)
MATRKSINITGFRHQNPIPNATRIGNLLMSGIVLGFDPGTRNLPADLDGQLTNVFAHVKEIVETAGGSTDDIIKITVWLKDPSNRELLNKHWTRMFPDENARPSRHTQALTGDTKALVQCDIVAVFN